MDSSVFNSHACFLSTDGNKRVLVDLDFTGLDPTDDDPFGRRSRGPFPPHPRFNERPR